LAVSRCDEWTPPPSWTIRSDGILRRALSVSDCKKLGQKPGCLEQYTLQDWLVNVVGKEKTKQGTPYSIGICITPKGAEAITSEILQLEGH
jgi:hypothetical protein